MVGNKAKDFFWNMAGSLCNAISSMLLLIIVNRVNNAYDGGLFSLGFATAQMMATIGTLEVRNFQSTDVKAQFSFNDYFSFRILTCVGMMVFAILYVFANGYTLEKASVTLLLCLYKMIESFSDVFEGLYQQKNRIDYAGKSLFYRVLYSSIVFVIVLAITHQLLLAIFVMFLVSMLFACYYNKKITVKNWGQYKFVFNKKKWKRLFVECIPLATGAFIILYMGNAPKYAVDKQLGVELQNVFSIIFMPAFVINLFSLFVFRPMLTSMALRWNNSDVKGFLMIIMKAVVWLFLVTLAFLIGASLIGIPILSFVYGIDLSNYKLELLLIMLGGGINAFSTILRFTLTVIRKQKTSLLCYIIAYGCTIYMCPVLVSSNGLLGASYSYIISMLILSVGFAFVLMRAISGIRFKNNHSQ